MTSRFLRGKVYTVFYGATLQGLSFYIEGNMSIIGFVKSNNPVIIFHKPDALLNLFYLHNNLIGISIPALQMGKLNLSVVN